jgi:hypothetical protein
MADGLFGGGGAAFGIYPQMGGRRTMQDPQASADIPADVLRGRIAGLLGAIPDLLNLKRSLLPAEAVQALESYNKIAPKVPYGSEYYLQNLPLPPTSQVGQVANQLGSFVPLNPAPLARAVGKVCNVALSELARGMYGNEGSLANVIPSSMKPRFATEPIKNFESNFPTSITDRNEVKNVAEDFANQFKQMGFDVTVDHSGSKAGA